MRGFLVGSLALIVFRALVKPESAQRVEQGGNWLTDGVRRLLSGNVAGIPDRGSRAKRMGRSVGAGGAVGRAAQPPAAGSVVGAATPRLVQGGM